MLWGIFNCIGYGCNWNVPIFGWHFNYPISQKIDIKKLWKIIFGSLEPIFFSSHSYKHLISLLLKSFKHRKIFFKFNSFSVNIPTIFPLNYYFLLECLKKKKKQILINLTLILNLIFILDAFFALAFAQSFLFHMVQRIASF